jgi:hypothetical protein
MTFKNKAALDWYPEQLYLMNPALKRLEVNHF